MKAAPIKPRKLCKPQSQAQRGLRKGFVAVLLLVMLAVAAVTALTVNLWGSQIGAAYERKITRAALQKAKDAVLAYVETGNRTDLGTAIGAGGTFWTSINGRLPCVNLVGDGGLGGACSTANVTPASGISSLGLLPWRGLDIQPLRDTNGGCLWYAVSGNHKMSGLVLPTDRTEPTNADSNGLFTIIQPVKVIDGTGTVTWTEKILAGSPTAGLAASPDRVVAVIFAPGRAREGQTRAPAVADVAGIFHTCPLPALGTDSNPNAELSAPQFLETYMGTSLSGNNASLLPATPSSPRIIVQADEYHERLNDELIWITAEEFAKAATKRTARVLYTAINNYVAANGSYPPAAELPNGVCTQGRLQGFAPLTCALPGTTALNAGTRLRTNVDAWIAQTHYAVSESCIGGAGGTIANPCGGSVRINTGNGTNAPAILLMRGRPLSGQTCLLGGNLSTCIEDPITATTVNNALVLPPAASVASPLIQYRAPSTYSNDYLIRFNRE